MVTGMKYIVNTKDKQIIIIEGFTKDLQSIKDIFKGYQIIFQPIKDEKDGSNNDGNNKDR
jgi:hypothetical protein